MRFRDWANAVFFAAIYGASLAGVPTFLFVLEQPVDDGMSAWIFAPSVVVFAAALLWLRPRFTLLRRVRETAAVGQPMAFSWEVQRDLFGARGMGPGGVLLGLPFVAGEIFLLCFAIGMRGAVTMSAYWLLALAAPLLAMGVAFMMPRVWLRSEEQVLLAQLREALASPSDSAIDRAAEILRSLVRWPGQETPTA